MKCPVSMLPSASSSPAGVLFVIGAIAAIAYAMKGKANTNLNTQTKQ